MKFFHKNDCKPQRYKPTLDNRFDQTEVMLVSDKHTTKDFCNTFYSRGLLVKKKHTLSLVFRSLNLFMYGVDKVTALRNNRSSMGWFLEDALQKKLNSVYIFDTTADLIKPPFVIKSVLVPKKLRKKSKKKYLVKIVYKNDSKRVRSALKQLCHYSNKFDDGNFNVRLYKSVLFSFLDWKDSYLFKLKTTIFKNFFKA